MEYIKTFFFGAVILCVLAVWNDPERQDRPIRPYKPVISSDGWILQWEGVSKEFIRKQNEQRQQQGLTKGEPPRL